jgi:hypothetical protein
MLNYPRPQHLNEKPLPKKEDDESVVMQKQEVIDVLKTLDGLKRKLQTLLKT